MEIQVKAFTIPSEVSCRDGACGRLTRVVVDPIAREVTHLVVEPLKRSEPARLVPMDLVDPSSDVPRLRCSQRDFERLDPARETHFLTSTMGGMGYGPGQMYAWPFFTLAGGVNPSVAGIVGGATQVTRQLVPPGEVQVRRGEEVVGKDGPVGKVEGLVFHPLNHRLTHVLLQAGHLWGRRDVAIPIEAVTSVTGGIRINLTKDEVGKLPAVTIDRTNTSWPDV